MTGALPRPPPGAADTRPPSWRGGASRRLRGGPCRGISLGVPARGEGALLTTGGGVGRKKTTRPHRSSGSPLPGALQPRGGGPGRRPAMRGCREAQAEAEVRMGRQPGSGRPLHLGSGRGGGWRLPPSGFAPSRRRLLISAACGRLCAPRRRSLRTRAPRRGYGGLEVPSTFFQAPSRARGAQEKGAKVPGGAGLPDEELLGKRGAGWPRSQQIQAARRQDRKSTRLNSSH